jgi:hypothetical protein
MAVEFGSEPMRILRQATETYLESAYRLGKTEEDKVGVVSITETEKGVEVAREPSGLLWLSGVMIDAVESPETPKEHWQIEFLPNGGEDVYCNDVEVVDPAQRNAMAERLLAQIQHKEQAA